MIEELVVWFRAALDEEERIAQAAIEDDGGQDGGFEDATELLTRIIRPRFAHAAAKMITTHAVPRRVLAEVEADRLIIDRYVDLRDRCAADAQIYADWQAGKPVPERRTGVSRREIAQRDVLEFVVRARSLPHAERPGYREEWRPA